MLGINICGFIGATFISLNNFVLYDVVHEINDQVGFQVKLGVILDH
jgi:hypothetical protein